MGIAGDRREAMVCVKLSRKSSEHQAGLHIYQQGRNFFGENQSKMRCCPEEYEVILLRK
jgi:hypothetical protein